MQPMQSLVRDELTGLARGAELEARVARALGNRPGGRMVVLAVAGLDRFRHLNELLGYSAGDAVLVAWSAALERWLAEAAPLPGGQLARLGGDEFGILWPDCPSVTAGLAAGEALMAETRNPLTIAGREIYLTASAGLAVTEAGAGDALALIRQTAAAMRRAKRRGGNTLETLRWEEALAPEQRYELETALRQALARHEFSLRFQPQVDRLCRLDGLESLLSWQHPAFGPVSPEVFIKLAEEIGAIVEIGDWVLRHTCLQIAEWRDRGLNPPRVAVNVSPLQFSTPDYLPRVERILEETGVGGEALEFEITEGTLLRDLKESATRMQALRRLGISIAVDDFGVGYSPLTYLQELPLDAVKVDRAFTGQITKPAGSLPLVHTITILAHHRGLKVVAEGVETHEEMELLQAARCDRMQGYLFGTPMCAGEIETLLRDPNLLVDRLSKAGRVTS
jgi:diguanylate cyclase (GGDEF)-like protein